MMKLVDKQSIWLLCIFITKCHAYLTNRLLHCSKVESNFRLAKLLTKLLFQLYFNDFNAIQHSMIKRATSTIDYNVPCPTLCSTYSLERLSLTQIVGKITCFHSAHMRQTTRSSSNETRIKVHLSFVPTHIITDELLAFC